MPLLTGLPLGHAPPGGRTWVQAAGYTTSLTPTAAALARLNAVGSGDLALVGALLLEAAWRAGSKAALLFSPGEGT